MQFKEIIKKESENTNKILLFREGIFWKVYEKSAYLFFLYIKEFQPVKKFLKVVDGEVISIGFPSNSLEALFGSFVKESQDEKTIVIITDWIVMEEDFQMWKECTPLKIHKEKTKEVSSLKSPIESRVVSLSYGSFHSETTLKETILSFRIENRTPLECMIFLSNLTKELTKQL